MLTLQQMIDGVLAGAEGQALSKIAQAADGHVEDDMLAKGASEAPQEGPKRTVEREADKEEKAQGGGKDTAGDSEDTDMERVEKMASAIEEVVQVLLTDGTRPSVGRVVTAMEGAPENATQMPTNQNMAADSESAQFGEAKKKIPTNPGQEKVLPAEKGQAAMATTEDDRAQPVLGEKIGSLQRYVNGLHKAAADPSSPQASVKAGKSGVLPEDRPLNAPLAAGAEGMRAMLSSNEAALNLTKKKAKALPKQDLAALLSEKAQSRSTDKALDQTLGAQTVGQAGAKIASERKLKIAAARALITKIASEGCTCEQEGLEKGNCRFCKVASRLDPKTKSEKEAMVGDVQGASNVPTTVESSPAAGGAPQM